MKRKDFPSESQPTGADPLEILGAPEGATREEIRMAYRALANLHHPDKENVHPELDMDTEEFIAASLAYAKFLAEQEARKEASPHLNPIRPSTPVPDVNKVDLAPGVHVFETSSRYPRFIRV